MIQVTGEFYVKYRWDFYIVTTKWGTNYNNKKFQWFTILRSNANTNANVPRNGDLPSSTDRSDSAARLLMEIAGWDGFGRDERYTKNKQTFA